MNAPKGLSKDGQVALDGLMNAYRKDLVEIAHYFAKLDDRISPSHLHSADSMIEQSKRGPSLWRELRIALAAVFFGAGVPGVIEHFADPDRTKLALFMLCALFGGPVLTWSIARPASK